MKKGKNNVKKIPQSGKGSTSKKASKKASSKNGKGTGSNVVTSKSYALVKCYVSHPQLKVGGGVLVGGSCSSPVVTDADVYVGFDYTMWTHPKSYPWEDGDVVCVHMPVTDFSAPKNPEAYKKMIRWVVEQLAKGKTVHMGCMAGHGRTGMGLAAAVRVADGRVDAIHWVRKNYCEDAVESEEQISFLNEHYGIKKAKATKVVGGYYGGQSWGGYGEYYGNKYKGKNGSKPPVGAEVFTPVESDLFLLGDTDYGEW